MQDVAIYGFNYFSGMFSCWSAVFVVEKGFCCSFYGTGISELCTSCIAWSISRPRELHNLPWHPVLGAALATAKKHFPTI